jgi:pSer/pThr/pTyr-binding forkhead associated (FHA) protein
MPEIVFTAGRFVLAAAILYFLYRMAKAMSYETKEILKAEAGGIDPSAAIGTPQGGVPGSVFVVQAPNQRPRSMPLREEMTIGRSLQCDISVPDDRFISQYHARISMQNNSYVVEDLGSTNGTYLNGTRIKSPARVQRGDRVALGNTILEFRK